MHVSNILILCKLMELTNKISIHKWITKMLKINKKKIQEISYFIR